MTQNVDHDLAAALAANPFLAADGITVIVPIYNAYDNLVACLASVARHTRRPFRLILIDDASSDARVGSLLEVVRGAPPRVVVVRHPENRGLVRTANEGLALAAGDVVVLNSDTIVTAGWLDKMAAVARSRDNVATVTPLTNNGTICSVPRALVDNAIPDGYDIDGFGALVETASFRIFPEAPTGVGFCLLITRRALEAVGEFDAAAYGDGYGEENDFCQRAIRAGFVNLIADDTFVFHKGRASFEVRGDGLIARNLDVVAASHPSYGADVARFCRTHPLEQFHAYLSEHIAAERGRQRTIRARVLHVLHHGGGTEKHARDLASVDDPGILSCVLLSDGRTLDVDEYYAGLRRRSLRFPLPSALGEHGPLRNTGYRDALAAIVWTLGIDLIHVHHLMFNTLDIASVAAAAGIPYVMTLHDYHSVCPMYTLLDPAGQPCGACLDGSTGRSPDACMAQAGQQPAYLAEYQNRMRQFLAGAARLFAPSASAREVVRRAYPDLADAIEVIPHGHAAPIPGVDRPAYDGSSPLHAAVIGGMAVHKGASVLRDLLRANRRDTVFHLYGTTSDPDITRLPRNQIGRLDGSAFVRHGPYEATEIARRLVADGIHIGLHLSIWPETFSYTLSEFVEAAIPVIGGRMGAQGERIERCRLGWAVNDIRNPQPTLALLDEIRQRPTLLQEAAASMRRDEALVPLDAMWRRYVDVYHAVSKPKPPAAAQNGSPPPGRNYITGLTSRLAAGQAPDPATVHALRQLQHDVDDLRERLRSPRHRIADFIGAAIQNTPVLWPIVRFVTEAVLRQKR